MHNGSNEIVVSKILIHPIKSCRGISVESVQYTEEGLENDRLWCIVDATKLVILSARVAPKMVLITPTVNSDGTLRLSFPEDSGCASFSVPLRPSEDVLKTWTLIPHFIMRPDNPPLDGYVCEALSTDKGTASAILSQYFGKPVHLVFKGPRPRPIEPTLGFPDLVGTAKYQDMYPMLILSAESMSAIEDELRHQMDRLNIDEEWATKSIVVERFRPNIILKGGGPFSEDDWQKITIGSPDSPLIRLVSRCARCLFPNVNPENGERDKTPFVGCNAVTAGEGVINVGDVVYVLK